MSTTGTHTQLGEEPFNDTTHPPYATKDEATAAIARLREEPQHAIDVAYRLARTDTTAWADGAAYSSPPDLDLRA